jgi:hypothetical protein
MKGTDAKPKKERLMNSGTYHYSAELCKAMTDEQKLKLKLKLKEGQKKKRKKRNARMGPNESATFRPVRPFIP